MQLLLLEDDADLAQAVLAHLDALGHQVVHCTHLAQARLAAKAQAPDLVLLDRLLPDGDGLALLQQWRAEQAPWRVLVLTARDQVSDRVQGLRAGADDYLVKPFDLEELAARIEALGRRGTGSAPRRIGQARVDFDTHQAWRDGQPLSLTLMEWAVLRCLARQPGRLYPREDILQCLLRVGMADGRSNSLEVIVSRLRKKLGEGCIGTQRGLGYRLDG